MTFSLHQFSSCFACVVLLVAVVYETGRTSLCNPGWPVTEIPLPLPPRALGLKACATTLGLFSIRTEALIFTCVNANSEKTNFPGPPEAAG